MYISSSRHNTHKCVWLLVACCAYVRLYDCVNFGLEHVTMLWCVSEVHQRALARITHMSMVMICIDHISQFTQSVLLFVVQWSGAPNTQDKHVLYCHRVCAVCCCCIGFVQDSAAAGKHHQRQQINGGSVANRRRTIEMNVRYGIYVMTMSATCWICIYVVHVLGMVTGWGIIYETLCVDDRSCVSDWFVRTIVLHIHMVCPFFDDRLWIEQDVMQRARWSTHTVYGFEKDVCTLNIWKPTFDGSIDGNTWTAHFIFLALSEMWTRITMTRNIDCRWILFNDCVIWAYFLNSKMVHYNLRTFNQFSQRTNP